MDYLYDSVPRTIMQEELSSLMRRIIDNHVNAGQMASGKTAKSLRVEVSGEEGALYGKKFFGVLETGRKPGKIPKNFAAIIREWMKAKGLKANPIPYKREGKHKYTPQERGDMSMAAAIATSIAKRGTRQYRIGARDDIYSREIEETKRRIVVRMGEFTSQIIQSIKLNTKEVMK